MKPLFLLFMLCVNIGNSIGQTTYDQAINTSATNIASLAGLGTTIVVGDFVYSSPSKDINTQVGKLFRTMLLGRLTNNSTFSGTTFTPLSRPSTNITRTVDSLRNTGSYVSFIWGYIIPHDKFYTFSVQVYTLATRRLLYSWDILITKTPALEMLTEELR